MFKQIRIGPQEHLSRRQRRCGSCKRQGLTGKGLKCAKDILKSVCLARTRADAKRAKVRRLERAGNYRVVWARSDAVLNELESLRLPRQTGNADMSDHCSVVILNTSAEQLSVRFLIGHDEERYFEMEPHEVSWLLANPVELVVCRGMDGREATLNGWRVLPVGMVGSPYVVEAVLPPRPEGVPSLLELCAAELVRTCTAEDARALPFPKTMCEELAMRIGVPRYDRNEYIGQPFN